MTATTELLAELIRFPTESRSPNSELIDLYADRAARAGGVVDVVAGPAGRANLHVRFGPEAEGGIVLSGHTDVVPAGSGWATDPYALTEADGVLRGRGTADMKGFLAASLVAAEALDVGALRAPVHFALSFDEEIGCVGVRGLIERLVEQGTCAPELVVVGEPTSMRVCTAHTGKVAYRVAATARAGHSSRSRTDPTAIGALVAVAGAALELNKSAHPISANIGTIEGGVALNVLSAEAVLTLEVRHDASVDPSEVLEDVWKARDVAFAEVAQVGGAIEVESLIDYPALHTDAEHDAVQRTCQRVGSEPAGAVAFGCEAGMYSAALDVPAIILGPGDIGNAHRPDEFVLPSELEACETAVSALVSEFCVLK